MRVLVVSRHPFDMRLGDAVRVINFLKQLRTSHSFDLLCFFKPDQTLSDEVRAVFDEVTMLPFPVEDSLPAPWRALRALTLRSIAPVSEAMRAELATAQASGRYDVLYVNGASTLLNLPRGPASLPVLCDSIDSASLAIGREWKQANWPERAPLLRRWWHSRLLNALLKSRADANVFASELDASVFAQALPSIRTAGIPNGVDAQYFHPGTQQPERHSIVFEGNMMFGPNIDAALFLCNEIVPLVLKRYPDLRVYLVGRDPTEEVRALASSNVTVTGTVPDVRPYLWRSSIFVCPMRLGAGIKNKILQAWATGMPVIATSEAMGGLGGRDGENVVLRNGAPAFAEAICSILADPERGKRIAEAGRDRAVGHYSWAAQAGRLEQVLTEVVSEFATRRPRG